MKHSETLPGEEWRPVVGYPEYEVSSLGRIRSWKGLGGAGRAATPRILGGGWRAKYRGVSLCDERGVKGEYVHRIVASAFLPNPEGKREVNHIDGDKCNNALINLEWVTPTENKRHAAALGLSAYGERNGMTKFTADAVYTVKSLAARGLSYKAIAQEVGCSIMQANRIARGLLRARG